MKRKCDLDYLVTHRKKSRCATRVSSHECKPYPALKEALAVYMQESPDEERIYPKDRLVVDLMDAAGGASESEVIECLRYLREERGLRYGTRNGPRRFAWFRAAARTCKRIVEKVPEAAIVIRQLRYRLSKLEGRLPPPKEPIVHVIEFIDENGTIESTLEVWHGDTTRSGAPRLTCHPLS